MGNLCVVYTSVGICHIYSPLYLLTSIPCILIGSQVLAEILDSITPHCPQAPDLFLIWSDVRDYSILVPDLHLLPSMQEIGVNQYKGE